MVFSIHQTSQNKRKKYVLQPFAHEIKQKCDKNKNSSWFILVESRLHHVNKLNRVIALIYPAEVSRRWTRIYIAFTLLQFSCLISSGGSVLLPSSIFIFIYFKKKKEKKTPFRVQNLIHITDQCHFFHNHRNPKRSTCPSV